MAKKIVRFEASANLQRLLGRELIPNDEMAIVELVKNAYDSHAKHVRIFIQPETQREPGLIRISDDGSGMSEDEITRLFMFAGYSQRPDEVAAARRIPTGEKGIGRFAADKLGARLEVFTKKRQSKDGLHLTISWKDFENRLKKFNEVEAVYSPSQVPGLGFADSGTVLLITELRSRWDSQKIKSLRTDLADLLNPYATPKDFGITLEVAGSRTPGPETVEPLHPKADWSVDVSVTGERIHRVVRRTGDKEIIEEQKGDSVADLAYLRGLRAHFQYFDKRPNKTASRGLAAGVRVYRDGFRIEPFGSRTADWLHIAEKRAKRAGPRTYRSKPLVRFRRDFPQVTPRARRYHQSTGASGHSDCQEPSHRTPVTTRSLGGVAEIACRATLEGEPPSARNRSRTGQAAYPRRHVIRPRS